MSSQKKPSNLFNSEYWSYVIKNRRRKAWNTFVRFTACLVVFCTTYALILPAITIETTTYCGIEEHFHTDDCYAQDTASESTIVCSPAHAHSADCYDAAGALICGFANYVLHSHSELCHDASGDLICFLPEKAAHVHSDECYTLAETTATESAHIHGDSCYNVQRLDQTCQLAETEGHAHGEDCSTTALICTTEYDVHTHVDSCYESALTCTREEAAAHVHSDLCRTTTLICETEDGEHEHTDECFSIGYECGLEETEGHAHDESCYTATVICTTEQDAHVHGDSCYETTITCTTEETEGHTHTDACFVTEAVLSCGQEETVPAETAAPERILVCTQEQVQKHTHTDACYSGSVLACGMLQLEAHTHSDTCLQITASEPVQICEQAEHTHNLVCYSNPNADLETAEDWERAIQNADLTGTTAEDLLTVAKTQLGYKESTDNYIVLTDGITTKGYNRYGAWNGNAYEDWNEIFVEFCLHYAGIEDKDFPRATRSIAWTTVLANAGMFAAADYTPASGDLIFFEENFDIYVGIVSAVSNDGNVTAIVGDYENAVRSETLRADDEDIEILGYGILPELEEVQPETTEPEVTASETSEPEAAEPEATEPETTEPETTEPETTEPETTESQETQPASSEPLTANMTFEYTAPEVTASTFASRAAFFSRSSYALSTASENSLMTLDTGDSKATTSTTIDMTNMITDVVIQHKTTEYNDTWKVLGSGEKIQSGDLLRFAIQYQIPGGTLTSTNNSITYQLPVHQLSNTKNGIVYDNAGMEVGTYAISTTGLITITFNDYYVDENASGVIIDGVVNFDSSVEELDSDHDHTINLEFEGSETVYLEVEQTITDDLTIEKKAAKADEATGMIQYTVTVSSKNGTSDVVNFTDRISGASYYTDSTYGALTVSPAVDNLTTPAVGATSIDLTLPQMGAGTAYTITYYAKVDSISQDTAYVNNSATVRSKTNDNILTDTATTQTPFTNNMVQKTHSISGNTGEEVVTWTVTVGSEGTDLSGWTLSDIINGAALQEVTTITYKKNSDGTYADQTISHTLPYSFPEGAYGPATVTYTTTLDYQLGSGTMNNTATLTPPDHTPPYPSYSDTDTAIQTGDVSWHGYNPLSKDAQGLSVNAGTDSENQTATIHWVYTIDADDGAIYTEGGSWYFKDALGNYQYFTADQWSALETAIQTAMISAFNTQNESHPDDETAVTTWTQDNANLLYTLEKTMSGEDIVGFKVYVKQNFYKGSKITFEYNSTAPLGDGNSQITFGNYASINDKVAVSDWETYYPVVQKMDAVNGSTSETSHPMMDLEDGALSWKIQLFLPSGTNADVTITEDLPAEVDLTSLSFLMPDGYTVVNFGEFGEDGKASCTVSINGTEYTIAATNPIETQRTETSGETTTVKRFTITIPAALAAALAQTTVSFTVNTNLVADFAIPDTTVDSVESKALTNRVTVTTGDTTLGTDDHTQNITNEDTVQNMAKEAGTVTDNIIPYTLTINPEGRDLIPGEDYITVTDSLVFWNYLGQDVFDANLVPGSLVVQIYENGVWTDYFNADSDGDNANDSLNYTYTQMSENPWSNNEEKTTCTLEVQIPDSVPVKVTYRYKITGTATANTTISNTATLQGVGHNSSSLENTWLRIEESDAEANLGSVNIYKVDSTNFAIHLSGAEYELYAWEPIEGSTNTYEWRFKQIVVSSGDNLELQDLQINHAYYLIETKAPSDYILDQTRHYFLIYDEATLTNNPLVKPDSFPANAYVARGGAVYITNEKAGTSVSVEKIWKDANGETTSAPEDASINVELRQMVSDYPVDFDTSTWGQEASVDLHIGSNSYSSDVYTQNNISAHVGDVITITLTTSDLHYETKTVTTTVNGTETTEQTGPYPAGLMEVTDSANIHVPYTRTEAGTTASGNKLYTYVFTYVVTGNAALHGWVYSENKPNTTIGEANVVVTHRENADLTKTPTGEVQSITLSGSKWTHTFANLPEYKLSSTGRIEGYYSYQVVETNVPNGYIVEYSAGGTADDAVTSGNVTITNSPEPKTNIAVEKEWYDATGAKVTDTSSLSDVQFKLWRKSSYTDPNGSATSGPGVYPCVMNLYTGGSGSKLGDLPFQSFPKGTILQLNIYFEPTWDITDQIVVTLNGNELTDTSTNTDTQRYALYSYQFTVGSSGDILAIGIHGDNIEYWNTYWNYDLTVISYPSTGTESGDYLVGTYYTGTDWTWLSSEVFASGLPLVGGDSNDTQVYYSYYIEEVNVPDSYDVTYKVPDGNAFVVSPEITSGTLVMMNKPKDMQATTSVTVTKQWQDADGNALADSEKTAVQVVLLQDGTAMEEHSYTLSNENGWTKSINSLPVYDDSGEPYEYSFQEVTVEGFTTTYSGSDGNYTIINTKEKEEQPETTSIIVKKVWKDANGSTFSSPSNISSISFNLYKDGSYFSNYTLMASKAWETVIDNLEPGHTYTVQETNVPAGYVATYSVSNEEDGYTLTITNTASSRDTSSTTEVSVKKEWDGIAADDQREVEIQLYQVAATSPEVTLFSESITSANPWTWPISINTKNNFATFDPSMITQDGYFSVYYTGSSDSGAAMAFQNADWGWYQLNTPSGTVQTETGYISTFRYDHILTAVRYENNVQVGTLAADMLSGLNAVHVGPGNSNDIVITKVTWTSTPAPSETRFLESVKLNTGNSWSHTWSNLPKSSTQNGVTTNYAYYVAENTADYKVTYSNGTTPISEGEITVTNAPLNSSISITVEKKWIDQNNAVIAAPVPIAFNLYKVESDNSETLINNTSYSISTAENSKTITGLEPGTYRVEEVTTGYNVTYKVGDTATNQALFESDGTFVITNQAKSVTVTKNWRDQYDNPLSNPSTDPVSIKLYQNTTEYGTYSIPVETDDSWSLTINGLPVRDANGTDYNYTFSEVAVTGFDTAYSNDTYTITNTRKSTSVTVTKQWKNADNTELDDSEKVAVQVVLLQDNLAYGEAITLSSTNNWTVTIEKLPMYSSSGQLHTYSFQEISVPGFSTTYSGSDGNFTITNTKEEDEQDKASIQVDKQWVGTAPEDYVEVELSKWFTSSGSDGSGDSTESGGNTETGSLYTIGVQVSNGGNDASNPTYYHASSGQYVKIDYVTYNDTGHVKVDNSDVGIKGSNADSIVPIGNSCSRYTYYVEITGNMTILVGTWTDDTTQIADGVKINDYSIDIVNSKPDSNNQGVETTSTGIETPTGSWVIQSKHYLTAAGPDGTVGTTDDWTLAIDGLEPGTYKITETTTGKTYTATYSVDGEVEDSAELTLSAGGTASVTITNAPEDNSTEISVQKQWTNTAAEDQKPVTVQLYRAVGEVSASYTAFLGFADANWKPEIGAETDVTVSTIITGAGNYTLSWNLDATGFEEDASGSQVFYIDIYDPLKALTGYHVNKLQILADNTEVTYTALPTPVYENDYFRIMFYSALNSHSHIDDVIDPAAITFAENLTVNFTLVGPNGDASAVLPRLDHETTIPLSGGTAYGNPIVLGNNGVWNHTWEELPLFDEEDPTTRYTYYVVETTPGYITTYSHSISITEGTFIITNEVIPVEELPYSVSLQVGKKWVDSSNSPTDAPVDSVKFELLRWQSEDSIPISLSWGTWGSDHTTTVTVPKNGTITLSFIGVAAYDDSCELDTKTVTTEDSGITITQTGKTFLGTTYFSGTWQNGDESSIWEQWRNTYRYTYTIKVGEETATVSATFNGMAAGSPVVTTDTHNQIEDYEVGIESIDVSEPQNYTWVSMGIYDITAADKWSTTLSDLEPGKYKIVETTTGYETTYSATAGEINTTGTDSVELVMNTEGVSGVATITNKFDTTSITVNKQWVNANGSSYTPIDESVKLTLVQIATTVSGETTTTSTKKFDPITLSANNWSYTFTNLPTTVTDGTATTTYTYYVVEENGAVYDVTYEQTGANNATVEVDAEHPVSSGTITVTNKVTSLAVNKVWVDNADNVTHDPITVNIYRAIDGQETPDLYGSVQLTDSHLTEMLSGLPVADANGKRYTYTVDEVVPEGFAYSKNISEDQASDDTFSYTITNTKIEMTDITVKKDWGSTNSAPIEVQLYRFEHNEDPEENVGTYVSPTNYTAYLRYAGASGDDWWPQTGSSVYTTVTGPGTYSFTWNLTDASSSGIKQFEIEIQNAYSAFNGNYQVSAVTVTTEDGSVQVDMNKVSTNTNWKTDDGTKYYPAYEHYIIVLKESVDETLSFEDYLTVTFTLTANGITSGTGNSYPAITCPDESKYGDVVTLGTNDNWEHTWSNLPKYEIDAQGNTVWYTYYVKELTTGYITTYSTDSALAGGTVTIYNRAQPDTPSYELPATGGSGTGWHLMAGMAMILSAAYLLYADRKRRKRAS